MTPSAIHSSAADGNSTVLALRKILTSESILLARRFRALFSLKHLACQQPPTAQTLPAIRAIAAGFSSPSALLKHELAYCLGQSRNLAAVPFLRAVLSDRQEDAMCRHEAAEALGALGDEESLELLKHLRDATDEPEVVTETCDIAVARIEWEHSQTRKDEKPRPRYYSFRTQMWGTMLTIVSDFASIDPAPPLAQACETSSIPLLEGTLLDTSVPLFQRYRAMFALRDLASPPDLPSAVPAVKALALGFHDPSALFRHEIAFVFGQLSHPASVPSLVEVLSDTKEESMVRHEAAEALGSLGDEKGVEAVLKRFANDQDQVVRESILVALDMAEFERNGETEYALIPESVEKPVMSL